MAKHDGHLGSVYAAADTSDLARAYDGWAETYDIEMAGKGYRHPNIVLALTARHLPRGATPVLDAGAGTGLIGGWLQIVGYPRIEALDISPGMLAIAERKGCYAALHRAAMGTKLPFADGHFAGIVSAGVFTTGHVGPEGFDDLVRICRRGGVIVTTVKDALWHAGFADHIAAFEKAGRLKRLEETAPYSSMPGDPATTPARALALKVL